jgi:hypothetical protein
MVVFSHTRSWGSSMKAEPILREKSRVSALEMSRCAATRAVGRNQVLQGARIAARTCTLRGTLRGTIRGSGLLGASDINLQQIGSSLGTFRHARNDLAIHPSPRRCNQRCNQRCKQRCKQRSPRLHR